MEKIQLLIKHAKVFNSYLKKFIDADVSVKDGKFYYIDRKHENLFDAEQTIDADGQYMIPGMVDIHMHIESSMLAPRELAKVLLLNGVTGIFADPHEVAEAERQFYREGEEDDDDRVGRGLGEVAGELSFVDGQGSHGG